MVLTPNQLVAAVTMCELWTDRASVSITASGASMLDVCYRYEPSEDLASRIPTALSHVIPLLWIVVPIAASSRTTAITTYGRYDTLDPN